VSRRSLRTLHFKSEAELVALTRDWLLADGWEVYLEVAPWGAGASRADIVATRGPLLAVYECKLSMSLALLEQCATWPRFAHQVWAVTPPLRRSRFANDLAKGIGAGVVEVNPPRDYAYGPTGKPEARVHCEAPFRRRIDPLVRDGLEEASKFTAPGAAHGFITPFQMTCERLRTAVTGIGGRLLVKKAIDSLQHHYSSTACARSSLISGVERGIIAGLRIEREGRAVYFVADAAAARRAS